MKVFDSKHGFQFSLLVFIYLLYINSLLFTSHDQSDPSSSNDSLHPNRNIFYYIRKCFTWNVLLLSFDVCVDLQNVFWLGICINAVLQIASKEDVRGSQI